MPPIYSLRAILNPRARNPVPANFFGGSYDVVWHGQELDLFCAGAYVHGEDPWYPRVHEGYQAHLLAEAW